MDHIAVLHRIVLTLKTPLAGVLGPLLAAVGHKVFEANDLGPNKAALKIGMNTPRRLRCRRRLTNGPGANFLLPGGVEGLQAQRLPSCSDQAGDDRLCDECWSREALILGLLRAFIKEGCRTLWKGDDKEK